MPEIRRGFQDVRLPAKTRELNGTWSFGGRPMPSRWRLPDDFAIHRRVNAMQAAAAKTWSGCCHRRRRVHSSCGRNRRRTSRPGPPVVIGMAEQGHRPSPDGRTAGIWEDRTTHGGSAPASADVLVFRLARGSHRKHVIFELCKGVDCCLNLPVPIYPVSARAA